MCGIAGVISISKDVDLSVIKNMTDSIAHRGPNGEGQYKHEHFAFGHRRLAIVDLSEAGHQPMHYNDRYTITYNGEVYNHPELREELEQHGYVFKSHTDTEVIMAAYDFWGKECLNKFNGMWAFVIYDKQTNKFFIARDRFGIKPLYYFQNDDKFIFASEIKAILAHPEVKPEANIAYLADYVESGAKEYIKETAFNKIHRFPFAHYIESSPTELISKLNPIRFWSLKPNLKKEKFSKEKAQKLSEQYYSLLSDAVKIRLRADVKVGSALSGGLDSSSIVYLVNQHLKEAGKEELQETFSNIYTEEETKNCDESKFINLLAKALSVNSNQIEPQLNEIALEYPKMIRSMESPPESTCMSGKYTFKKVAQSDVRVTLDGQGADEQLGGYFTYLPTYLLSLNVFDFYKNFIHLIKLPNTARFLVFTFFLYHFLVFFGEKYTKKLVLIIKRRKLYLNLNEQMVDDLSGSLVNLLHYGDSHSMEYSIESRMPFMDYRVVEFLASIPVSYKMHGGWTKYIARLAFSNRLPDEITWRKDKMGWNMPSEYWFSKTYLRKWLEDKVSNSRLLSKVDIERNTNNLSVIKKMRLLNYAIWEECFFEKK